LCRLEEVLVHILEELFPNGKVDYHPSSSEVFISCAPIIAAFSSVPRFCYVARSQVDANDFDCLDLPLNHDAYSRPRRRFQACSRIRDI
jgi:hypothetical protein